MILVYVDVISFYVDMIVSSFSHSDTLKSDGIVGRFAPGYTTDLPIFTEISFLSARFLFKF